MRAVMINRFGGPEVLEIVDMNPPEPAPDEVLVRVQCAALNPKDVVVRKGKLWLFSGRKFPLLLGHDVAGQIVAVGKKVKDFAPGDAIFGMINAWTAGAYAEYAAMKTNEIALKPAQLSFAEAAAMPLAAQTSLQALRDLGRVKAGNRVLINGASGGVGTFAVQIAHLLGAHVTAVSSTKNHDLCRSLGADEVVDYRHTTFSQFQGTFDVFYDVFGNQNVKTVRHLLHRQSIYIDTIPSPSMVLRTLLGPVVHPQAKLVVVKSRRRDLELLSTWVEQGLLRPVIDRTFDFEQVAEGHRYLETKRAVGKVILNVSHQA